MGMEGRRVVYVRIGNRKEPVEIDRRTTAADILRKVGADPENYILTVNGASKAPEDKILPLLTGDDDLRVFPRTEVGSFPIFLTGRRRMKQEETLLREICFHPIAENVFRGVVKAGNRVLDMDVIFPATFPYARPMILIYDRWFIGKHPCIIPRREGIEVHFRDEEWKPWMHAVELVSNTVDFLERVTRRSGYICPPDLETFLSLLRSLRRR